MNNEIHQLTQVVVYFTSDFNDGSAELWMIELTDWTV